MARPLPQAVDDEAAGRAADELACALGPSGDIIGERLVVPYLDFIHYGVLRGTHWRQGEAEALEWEQRERARTEAVEMRAKRERERKEAEEKRKEVEEKRKEAEEQTRA